MTEGVDPGGSGREQEPAASGKSRRRRIIGAVGGIALVAVVFAFLLPKIADYADVWDVVTGLSGPAIAALVVATVINVATYGPPWMAALPGLNYRQSMVLTQSSTALSIAVPGGDAVGIAASYAMLRGWNFDRQAVAVAVVVTGVWNQIVNVVLPRARVVAAPPVRRLEPAASDRRPDRHRRDRPPGRRPGPRAPR